MSNENGERFPVGPQGAKGERGERGLSWLQTRSIIILFIIAAGLAVFGIFWINHAVNAATAAAQRQAAAEQAAQRQQGAVLELKLCSTLGKLAALKPPSGNPATNPARAFDQSLHSTLAQLGPDLGCGK